MPRTASRQLRIINVNVFVLSVATFLLLAADRSWTQNTLLFLPPVTYSSGGETNTSLALGDLNGDGKLDIVTANSCVANCEASTVGGFGVLRGNGDGTSSRRSSTAWLAVLQAPSRLGILTEMESSMWWFR